VNSGSWGFVANCFNVRRDAGTLKVFSNLGSDCRVEISFLGAVSKFCNPFPTMAVSWKLFPYKVFDTLFEGKNQK
jgi:hypothetical protein